MNQTYIQRKVIAVLIVVVSLCLGQNSWAGSGSGGGGGPTSTQVYDTSFAVEYSYSCLSGGCHETNTRLVTDYSKSLMTHTMVKCNSCHGTHTAAEVGKAKPNLTGYTVSSGATGYTIPNDRCLVCHSGSMNSKTTTVGQPCKNCHSPHVFQRK